MKRLWRMFKAILKDILNDIAEYWSVKLHLFRVKQAIKMGIYYSKANQNRRVFILPDHKGKPTTYFKENIRHNVKLGYFQKHVEEDTWLLRNAIEIIDGDKLLLDRKTTIGRLNMNDITMFGFSFISSSKDYLRFEAVEGKDIIILFQSIHTSFCSIVRETNDNKKEVYAGMITDKKRLKKVLEKIDYI